MVTTIKNLFDEAQNCQACYGKNPIYVPYPDPRNAQESAEIMFVNERPGRIGTGSSGYVSFDNEDPSANFFKKCFNQLKLDRKRIFITNACLCHPVFPDYKDKAPKIRDIRNCHEWLGRQLSFMKPKLIVTLGRTALTSMALFFSSSEQLKAYQLKDDIGKMISDTTPWVYPLYHTSRRGRINRDSKNQQLDWLRILDILELINRN